jgi:segregation and condensation protein A
MQSFDQDTFSLENFSGPLSFLLHLIQKDELDIYDIPIHKITTQYLTRLKDLMIPSVDGGAEFIGTAAFLLWMKSKMLLPKHEQTTGEEEELDPSFEIIHQLLAYCKFKEAAKDLGTREHRQSCYHLRAVEEIPEVKKGLGIEHLSIEDLASLFKDVLSRAPAEKGKIQEEEWRVGDKIKYIRNLFQKNDKVPFKELFTPEKSRGELIVTFLAVLELMKLGEGAVVRCDETEEIIIISQG